MDYSIVLCLLAVPEEGPIWTEMLCANSSSIEDWGIFIAKIFATELNGEY